MANLRIKQFSVYSSYLKPFIAAWLMFTAGLSAHAADAPLMSIKPLAMLYQALSADSASVPEVLLSGEKNPHDYQLSVEDIRRLQSSTAFYYFGSEANLSKLSRRLSNDKWHQLKGNEAHAWLSHKALLKLIPQLSKMMQKQQPELAKHIQQREKSLLRQLQQRFDYWQKQFGPYANEAILLGHTAFEVFVKDLGLKHVEIYRSGHSHGHKADGMHDLISLQKEIAAGDIRCAVEEPDISFAKLQARHPSLALIQLQPMAQSIELEAKAFIHYIDTNAAAIYQCLKGAS